MLCVCMCVCTFIYVGGSLGKCVARGKSARSPFDFILFYFIFIDSNIPHKRLSALNFSVRDISFHQREKKNQLKKFNMYVCR